MAVQLGIKDFAYFVFCFAIQFYWWGGGCSLCGKGFGKAGSSWEMWNTGWTPQNCCRRWTVMECVPGVPIILNSPRFFSTSFLEGRVVRKNFTFTYTWSPILKAGDGIHCFLVAFLGLCDQHFQLGVQLVQVCHITLSLGGQ